MTRENTGRFIGATFGLAFVQVNAAALPPAVGIPVRVLAALAFVGLFLALRRASASRPAKAAARAGFGRRYRFVVAAEAVVGLAGILFVDLVLHTPHAMVGWIALVVGLHFFGLAAIWRMPSLHWLGAGMSACGAAGLVLAVCGFPQAAVAAVAGVVPGAMLLGSVWWDVLAGAQHLRAATTPAATAPTTGS
ncbi:hypothetical protein [Streptomyces sp. NPDC097981]|uniref:hypothetical protein n=1 Tax=Streptomyces sp. NPDC097981 TaxID=3155428 RepID=UPI00331C54D8